MTPPDFRSDPMPSPEGKGRARRVWDAYARTTNKTIAPLIAPVVGPAVAPFAREWVMDMMGFWVTWHLHGGFEGLEGLGFHRATIYRKISRFRFAFGVHPDEFEFPGVTLDPAAYWAATERPPTPTEPE